MIKMFFLNRSASQFVILEYIYFQNMFPYFVFNNLFLKEHASGFCFSEKKIKIRF